MVDVEPRSTNPDFPAQSDDRDAIIKVIEDETAAWIRGDIGEWRRLWVHAAHAQHINARPFLGLRALCGFDEIERYFTPIFATIAEEDLASRELRRENWRITIGSDMAWATFDQVLPVDGETAIASGRHSQMRILEKVEGTWKISALFQVPNRYGYYASPWVRVDGRARIVDTGPGLAEALNGRSPLRIVGNRLCGHGSAETKKLRDAISEADELVSARRARPASPLLLKDADGRLLPPCWVTVADMMILILLHDDALLTDAVGRAGKVLGLTPAQTRVAESIARGHDLNATAADLQVRPNTVRTHVRRMFDHLNVNSQPALVRAVLSVSPPS